MLTSLMKLRNRTAKRGFTLIELLVVVAIIGLLAAFAVPKLFEAINKSKEAPGKADMQTIAAALDRYYFDKGNYPKYTANDAAAVDALKAELGKSYLKANTTFRNGFDQGYLYASSVDGKGYILIDVQGALAADYDDNSSTAGQQIRVSCTDGSTPTVIEWTVTKSKTSSLTLPVGTTINVPNNAIDTCTLANASATVRALVSMNTH